MGRHSVSNQHEKHKIFQHISLNIDYETITDDFTNSNHFNNFFTSIAKNLVNKIPKTPKSFESYIKIHTETLFSYHPQQQKTLKTS